jgi:hypothetical protein
MRGRNNNRKGPNPLTRNYESNGPDVKIRGSAQQIAEKYAALARDAQSAGDRVMAENYLQHAEHYNRVIAAAQGQMAVQQVRESREDFDEDFDEERDEPAAASGPGEAPASAPASNGSGPQPVIEGVPAEVALNQEPVSQNGTSTHDRNANGGHTDTANGVAEEGQSQQRRRRPRRSRGRPEQEAAGTGDAEAGSTEGAADADNSETGGGSEFVAADN